MKRGEWSYLLFLSGLSCLLLSGCGRRFWNPSPDQMAEAERIAKHYVLREVSDQAGTPFATAVKLGSDGLPSEYPVAFTIQQTPYARYRTKFWGARRKGARIVNVQYFDPTAIPHWDSGPDVSGEYPAFFEIAVDIDQRTATRNPMPK